VTLVLRYAARSDRGLVRANNEDSVYAGARLLALADGMGGHAAGEVASQLVIAALAHLDDDEPGGDLLSKLDSAVRSGNTAIAAQVEMEPDLEGMGTTLTAILFAGNRLGLVHIGDSRGYLLRDGELNQITKDDTFVQTLVDEGRITAEEAHSHPQRSLIMRALTGHEVEPTLTMREARAGDRYLLCSDGLSDPVSDETIAEALQIPDVAESAYRLIELALRGGGPDNVTVVVADVVDYEYGQTQPILAGAVSGEEEHATLPNTAAGRASAIRPRKEAAQRISAPVEPPKRSKWSRWRLPILVTLVTLVLISGLFVGWMLIQKHYYVAEYNGKVTVMRGLAQDALLGVSLHKPDSVACIDDQNALQLIPYGQAAGQQKCQILELKHLTQSGQAQVQSGLPGGNKQEAEKQLKTLLSKELCSPLHPVAPNGPSGTPATTEASQPAGPESTATTPAGSPTSPSGNPAPSPSHPSTVTATSQPSGAAGPPANTPANTPPAAPPTNVNCRKVE
jgi:PPM family protein phosphatase